MAGRRGPLLDRRGDSRLSAPFRIFVTGTDTGVGKTQAACALLSLLSEMELRPAPFKPYESGCSDLHAPADACALRAAAKSEDDLKWVCPHRFRAPLAPGAAAERLGRQPSFQKTLAAFRHFGDRPMVVEGAGGLFVPLDRRRDVLHLIKSLRLPVLLVARSGLGTLNHTGLSLEVMASQGIAVRAVLLSRVTPTTDSSERDNGAWIRRRHRLMVLGPVSYEPNAKRRRLAFRRALRPLLQR